MLEVRQAAVPARVDPGPHSKAKPRHEHVDVRLFTQKVDEDYVDCYQAPLPHFARTCSEPFDSQMLL